MKSKNQKEDAEGIAMKCRESVAEAFPKPSKEPKPPKAWRNAKFAFITGHAVKGMEFTCHCGQSGGSGDPTFAHGNHAGIPVSQTTRELVQGRLQPSDTAVDDFTSKVGGTIKGTIHDIRG